MEREITRLLEIRAKYAADSAAARVIDHCIDLCRQATAVTDREDVKRLQQEVADLLARLGRPAD